MLPGRKYTPEDVVRILLRHKWLVLLPFAVGLLASLVVASRIPARYRSDTLIMVMPQRISTEILPQMVNDRIEDRLPSISDQILSRSRLERIIADADLYAEQRARGMIMEDVVQLMRDNDIKVAIEGRGKQSFRVTYESENPATAQKVTERLASLYIEENLKDKDNLAQSTNSFIESELESARARLIEQEKKLEAYKKRYAGQLPSQLESNQQAIQSAQLQLQSVGASINRARERRLLAQQQLADAHTLPIASMVPDVSTGANPAPLTAVQQLEAAEAALAAANRRYKPDHPDVRTLERTIIGLRAKAQAESREPEDRPARPLSAAESARQKRIRDLEAEIAIVDRQIVTGEQEEIRLKGTIAEYEGKIAVVPTRESELVELNRDYLTLDTAYQSLLKKKEDSMLAANVERRQIGETFRVIDPASVPQRPFNQWRRLQVVLGGAVGGLVLGLAFIGLLEYRDSSFKNEDDVVRVLSLPVLALVPVMGPVPAPSRRWWRRGAFGLFVVIMVLGSTAAIAFWRMQS